VFDPACAAKMFGAKDRPIAFGSEQLLQGKGIGLLRYRNHAWRSATAAGQCREGHITLAGSDCLAAPILKKHAIGEAIADQDGGIADLDQLRGLSGQRTQCAAEQSAGHDLAPIWHLVLPNAAFVMRRASGACSAYAVPN
jgi:hypothetical protein